MSNYDPYDVIYFQPYQIVFHVASDLTVDKSAVESVIGWATNRLNSQYKGIELSEPKVLNFKYVDAAYRKPAPVSESKSGAISTEDRRHTAPDVEVPSPFALVFVQVKYAKYSEHPLSMEATDELLEYILELDDARDNVPYLGKEYGEKVPLDVVSPNWLMSAGTRARPLPDSARPVGTGGPGGHPSYYAYSKPNASHKFILPQSLHGHFSEVNTAQGGDGVVVAVLDTAYSKKELIEIYKKWVIDRTNEPHEVIHSLFGEHRQNNPFVSASAIAAGVTAGRYTVHHDSKVDAYLPKTRIIGHNYNMVDHGLFVSGIINSLAPSAEIHLYQVLNDYGLGDLRSIADALQDVVIKYRNRPLVVNMSLTLNIPLGYEYCRESDVLGRRLLDTSKSHKTWLLRQPTPLEKICDLVYVLGGRVIAAAGNDRKDLAHPRPPARYPAAFKCVFGVGALPKGIFLKQPPFTPSNYSNLADEPAESGITTLGGEEGEGNGVLGVYAGKVPGGGANTTGWAWWSGTSFATPIISGITAAVLGNLIHAGRQASTQDAVNELFKALTVQTIDGEDVFPVDQG